LPLHRSAEFQVLIFQPVCESLQYKLSLSSTATSSDVLVALWSCKHNMLAILTNSKLVEDASLAFALLQLT